MAVLEIPLRSDLPHFDLTLPLDGIAYRLLFRWNSREAAWYLSCSLEDETPLFVGCKIVVDFPLGRRCTHPSAPPGMLVARDSSGRKQDPGLTDLGARVRLLYFDKESVAAMTEGLT